MIGKLTRALRVSGAGLMCIGMAAATGGAQAGGDGSYYKIKTRYAGEATVVIANTKALTLNSKLVLADTGPLEQYGATREDTVLAFNNPPPLDIDGKTATATTSGMNDTAASMAAVQKLRIALPGLLITADVIEANTKAECRRESMTVHPSGSSTLLNLRINGTPIASNSPPNTTHTIPGVATIIINEQYNPDVNTIVVNALHVKVPGAPGVASSDIIISHAMSGILTCPCNHEEPPAY